jgi:hypothetical protein
MHCVRLLALTVLLAVTTGCGAMRAGPGAAQRTIERYGIEATIPDGWHARLTRGTLEAATVPLGADVQHVALGPDDLVARLFEDPSLPEFAGEVQRTHPEGAPQPFSVGDFGPPEGGGDNPGGHGWARRNFRLGGRIFDLFVEAGAPHPGATEVEALNRLVASLDVSAGDFYPGSVEPPSFAPSDGWDVGAAGGGDVDVGDYAEAWASTVPYEDAPHDLPPSKTLESLPADGIVIWVGIDRDNRFPPDAPASARSLSVPLQLADAGAPSAYEGDVGDTTVARLWGRAGAQFDVDLWVFFGRQDPPAGQRARAQAMLDRLRLPDWGAWEVDGRGTVEVG